MSKDLYEFERINIFTLGNSIIGKSTFIIRYTQNIFEERYIANYGIDYKIKKIILPNGKKLNYAYMIQPDKKDLNQYH